MTEAVAVLRGIDLAIETGLTPFVVETNALAVVNLIQTGKASSADIGLVIGEILSKLQSVPGGLFCMFLGKLILLLTILPNWL